MVKLLAGLRDVLGNDRLELPAVRLCELLVALGERGGAELARRLWADPAALPPEPNRDLRVLVNGRDMRFLAGLETSLGADDVVTLHLAGARGWPGGEGESCPRTT